MYNTIVPIINSGLSFHEQQCLYHNYEVESTLLLSNGLRVNYENIRQKRIRKYILECAYAKKKKIRLRQILELRPSTNNVQCCSECPETVRVQEGAQKEKVGKLK